MKWLLTLTTLAMAGAVLAQGPKSPRPMERGRQGGMLNPANDPIVRLVSNPKSAERIGLSAEQIASIKQLSEEQRKFEKANRERMREAMRKQTEMLRAEKIDEAQVMAAIDELFEIRKELAKSQTRRVIKVKSLLTPEQIAKALEESQRMLSERKAKRKAPESLRGNPPPPPSDGEPGDDGEAKPAPKD